MRTMQGKNQYLAAAIMIAAAHVLAVINTATSHAAQITSRSLTLQTGGSGDGGSKPGGTVNHKFDFTVPSTGTTIGSIKFEYCNTAAVTSCVAPTGMDASCTTFGGESGGATGFSVGNGANAPAPTANVVYIRRATAANPTVGGLSYTLNGIVNPSPTNYTFFVRISTYSSTDGTGSAIDTGSVAASTANQIEFSGVMPETLVFCTGITVTANCDSVTTGVINLGVFSPSAVTSATSEMAASTNADHGYIITVTGDTLKSGSNSIPAIGATAATSAIGTGQFGLNLMDNATPDIGAGVSPATGGSYTAAAVANFNTANSYAFTANSAQTVASTSTPSAAQEFTVSYIINVAGNQSPGTYTTTLTYICTPTY